ncbi:MAG: methyltransferase [Bacteroidetes bacterium]|nr:MAG: methyltransferase [Bacteroidota bacterium]TAG87217.1 MAG: methyltransferase [Bacteroidota bacterium]
MTYKDLVLSENNTYFLYQNKNIFDRFFINALKFHDEGLAAVQDEMGWFHINLEGKDLYKNRYKRTFGYYFGASTVIDFNDNAFHLDIKGTKIYAQNYAWCGNFQQKICVVKNFENQYFHIDLKGNKIYPENYLYAGDFYDNYACVMLKENKLFKHIDLNGKDLNGHLFQDLGVFHKGFATAKDAKGWFHIDKKGNEIYKERYLQIEPFYNGCALVTTFENEKKIINDF